MCRNFEHKSCNRKSGDADRNQHRRFFQYFYKFAQATLAAALFFAHRPHPFTAFLQLII